MKLDDIFCPDCEYEIVYIDEDTGEIIEEGFVRQMKRVGTRLKKQYRCTTGPKKGKIAADPKACGKRKDPKKRRHGKKVARMRKGVRVSKTRRAKRQATSRLVTRINRRLAGKSS